MEKNTKNQKSRSRKNIGKINVGVGHKIRRTMPKRNGKVSSVKTALSVLQSSALSDYLTSPKHIQKNVEAPKLIEDKGNKVPSTERQIIAVIDTPRKITVAETKDSTKCLSSPEHVPDPNTKFFEFSRARGVVKMNKIIQPKMDHEKLSLIDKNKQKTQNKHNYFNLNESNEEEPLLKRNIESIKFSLDYETVPDKNKIVLQAHNSVIDSENSILLHQPRNAADLILPPISQMCDVTSGLALDSPKKNRNLTPISDGMKDSTNLEKNKKLFPIFYPQATKPTRITKKTVNLKKKIKKLSESQMLLNAGQKKFGVTLCHDCNFVYHMGDPSDEIMHLNYHSAKHNLRFPGWKKERIVADFQDDGRIIQLVPDDSKIWWKKVCDLMDLINREIGSYNMDFSHDKCQAFLYIKKKIIIGCLVATEEAEGYKLLSSIDSDFDVCSELKYPIKCGVPRIWVSANHRRQGVATKMMNALKMNFISGYILNNFDIAFSSPTEAGKKFGQAYFQTNNFYIYF